MQHLCEPATWLSLPELTERPASQRQGTARPDCTEGALLCMHAWSAPSSSASEKGLSRLFLAHAGTLTLNQLSVDKKSCLVMPGYDINTAMMYGALSANIVSEEPIDMVLHESYEGNATLWNDWTLEKFVPFNPTDKYTIAVVKNKASGEEKRIMKGAPQVSPASTQRWCPFSTVSSILTHQVECEGKGVFSSQHPVCCRLCSVTPTTLSRLATKSAARSQSLPCAASGPWVSPSPMTSTTRVSSHTFELVSPPAFKRLRNSTAGEAWVLCEQSCGWELQINATSKEQRNTTPIPAWLLHITHHCNVAQFQVRRSLHFG